MFEIVASSDENKFSWSDIGSISEGRRNLGENMPVFVYRLLEYTIKDELTRRYGSEAAIDIFREAGELAGFELANHLLNLELPLNDFIAQLQDVLAKNKIGILRIEKYDTQSGDAVLTVAEDLDCSGLPITGETVCYFDEGFLAGILKAYTKKEHKVVEVDCWATGARVCRFEARVKRTEGE